jgi:hypothetical protein
MSIYQNPQFQGFSKEELAQSEAHGIYASIAIVAIIATIGVVLRFLSRRKSKAGLSYDDYTIVAALVYCIGIGPPRAERTLTILKVIFIWPQHISHPRHSALWPWPASTSCEPHSAAQFPEGQWYFTARDC